MARILGLLFAVNRSDIFCSCSGRGLGTFQGFTGGQAVVDVCRGVEPDAGVAMGVILSPGRPTSRFYG